MRTLRRLVLALVFVLVGAAPATAVTRLIGDIDGFGLSPTTDWKAADGGPADRDGDGILKVGDFLPDQDGDGRVTGDGGDTFDRRTALEIGADDGAQWTDKALSGAGVADGARFTFTFRPPELGEPDFGVDHYVELVFADYDVGPFALVVDGAEIRLVRQRADEDGLIQLATAAIPWAAMADGRVEILVKAPHESLLAFDYARLDTDDFADCDDDGYPDGYDVCRCVADPAQLDLDRDGIGDACDNCPFTPNEAQVDKDQDARGDACDNCPLAPNKGQEDADEDSFGDSCDLCPLTPDAPHLAQWDPDGDGRAAACDRCPLDPWNDDDGDGVCGDVDPCPATRFPEEAPLISLAVGHWADLNGDGLFEVGTDGRFALKRHFTVDDTGGCSCTQIIDAWKLDKSHRLYGCSTAVMEAWSWEVETARAGRRGGR